MFRKYDKSRPQDSTVPFDIAFLRKALFSGRICEATYRLALDVISEHHRQNEGETTKWARERTADDLIFTFEKGGLVSALNRAMRLSHAVSVFRGWHNTPREDGTSIGLMHSELSEALEGIRKNLMDEKIPSRKMVEVELADAIHRIFDFCGKHDLDIGGAFVEKGIFNVGREDHDESKRGSNEPGVKQF